MVQPLVPALDQFGEVDDPDGPPALQRVGCLGAIERAEPQPDGRYHILLRGICRCRLVREDEPRRGYRQFVVDGSDFRSDSAEIDGERDPSSVLEALREFSRQYDLDFDYESLEGLSGVVLVNALSTALPFSPLEKQALLEAPGIADREEILLALMGMGPRDPFSEENRYREPTVH